MAVWGWEGWVRNGGGREMRVMEEGIRWDVGSVDEEEVCTGGGR